MRCHPLHREAVEGERVSEEIVNDNGDVFFIKTMYKRLTKDTQDFANESLCTMEKSLREIGQQLKQTERKLMKESIQYTHYIGQQLRETEERIAKKIDKIGHKLILDMEMIPRWAKDNEFILSYYRRPSGDIMATMKSLFYLHNEFFNIWSHIAGAILLCILGNFALDVLDSKAASYEERLACCIFLLSALTCMLSSVCYHLFRQHSLEAFQLTALIDYIGIAFLILGTFASTMYYAFYCQPDYIRFYVRIMIGLCVITGVIVTYPAFNADEYRLMKTWVFGLTSFFTIVPYIHTFIAVYRNEMVWLDLHNCVIGECAVYVTGMYIFAFRFPEGFTKKRGKYDLFLASHNIWHICVLLGLLLHFYGIYTAIHQSRDGHIGYQCTPITT